MNRKKGTSFRIYFPEIKYVLTAEKDEAYPEMSGKGETILVADDEPAIRDSMKSVLKEYGYRVIEATDREHACEKFKKSHGTIDLLVLDVLMPKVNGKEAYEKIKKFSPEIKVIFTSGYTADIIEQKAILDKGIPFIAKPVLPDKFLSKIRDVLGD